MIKSEILVPMLNANEPEARVAVIHVKDKQPVEKNALLFTIETTKAASDIESPETGFIHLLVKEGDVLGVGEKLAVLTEKADEKVEVLREALPGSLAGKTPNNHNELRITKPARALAESLGVDLTLLPTDVLITEEIVRQYAGSQQEISLPTRKEPYLVIFGAGGHAKTLLDMVHQLGTYAIAGIVDDSPSRSGTMVLNTPVLGTRKILPGLFSQGVKLAINGVGGIVDINSRIKVFEFLESLGFAFPSLVHPRATLEPSAKVGEGAQVFANAYVGSEAVLNPRSIVNTSSVVSHDCFIGQYAHIAPGALLAGHVHVGDRTLVGMGVTTAIGIRIGSGVRIGNGAIILADVPDRTIIQAGKTWIGKTEAPSL